MTNVTQTNAYKCLQALLRSKVPHRKNGVIWTS